MAKLTHQQRKKLPKSVIEKPKVRSAVKRKFPGIEQSTKGSPLMTSSELEKGYRSLGRGLPVMDGKPKATENRGEGY